MQDSKGYLWICTDVGVSRFDGKNFVNYGKEDGMDGGAVFICTEDSEGRIWFGSDKPALHIIDNENLYEYKYNDQISKFCKKSRVIQSITIKGGNVRLGFQYEGIIEIDSEGVVTNDTKYEGKVVEVDNSNLFTYSYNSGVENIVSTKQITLKSYDTLKRYFEGVIMPIGKKGPSMYALAYKNAILVSNHDYLFILRSSGIEQVEYEHIIDCIYKSKENILIGFLGGGVKVFNFQEELQLVDHFFKSSSITSICSGKNEFDFWLGTKGEGLVHISDIRIRKYEGVSSKVVSSVQKSKNQIYIGFYDGSIFGYDQENKIYDLKLKMNQFRSDFPIYFGIDEQGRILTEVYDQEKFSFSKDEVIILEQSSTIGFLKDYAVSSNTNYVMTSSRLYAYNGGNMKPIYWEESKYAASKIELIGLHVFDDEIFLGTSHGLFMVENGQLSKNSFYNNYKVNDIVKLDENVFLATEEHGVLWFVDSLDKTRPELLSFGQVIDLETSGDTVWLASENGIYFFNIKKDKIIVEEYFVSDQNIQYNYIDVEEGQITIGSNDGFFIDNRKISRFNDYKRNTFVSNIKIVNVSEPNNTSDHYTVGDFISVEFDTLNFEIPNNMYVQYRMVPGSENWKYLSSDGLSLKLIEDGLNRVQLRLVDHLGARIIRYSPTERGFTVVKPFYQSRRFMLLVVLFICSLSILFKILFNRVKNERHLKAKVRTNEINFLKLRSLFAQMNPHFTFNVLNSLQGLVLKNKKSESVYFLTKYARMLRNVLNSSSDSMQYISEEIDLLNRYIELENLRFQDKIQFRISTDNAIEMDKIKIPSMILQPVVENSIKHGINNEKDVELIVDLSLNFMQDHIDVIIEDNGIGYSVSQNQKTNDKHISYGMKIVKERLQIINQESGIKDFYSISDKFENGTICGTRVEIKFPLTYNMSA